MNLFKRMKLLFGEKRKVERPLELIQKFAKWIHNKIEDQNYKASSNKTETVFKKWKDEPPLYKSIDKEVDSWYPKKED